MTSLSKYPKSSGLVPTPGFVRSTARRRGRLFGVVLMAALGLAGCAVEMQNRQPAEAYAQQSKPPGSAYTGWRVYQDRCASCHGPDATGTAGAPDLLPRVRTLGPHQFVSLVLLRYDWPVPAVPAGSAPAARAALVEDVLQRKQGALTMPAWQGEPRVNAHIMDLHAYLAARAQGTLGPGRPTP